MDTKHHHIESGGFQLPAGLIDENVEIFSANGFLKGIYKGKTFDFNKLPTIVKIQFVNIYESEKLETPDCEKLIRKLFHCKNYQSELQQFTMCNYGGLDNAADFNKGSIPEKEYWNCGKRGKCKGELIVCKPHCIVKNNISLREIEIIKLISHGLQDNEMAIQLNLADSTITTHVRNIRKKLKVNNRGEIIRFAFNYNIAL